MFKNMEPSNCKFYKSCETFNKLISLASTTTWFVVCTIRVIFDNIDHHVFKYMIH